MAYLENIGTVSEEELIQPPEGISFRLNIVQSGDFSIALTQLEVDALIGRGVQRNLGRLGCQPYDFEVQFPRSSDNLLVVSRGLNFSMDNRTPRGVPSLTVGFHHKRGGHRYHLGELYAKHIGLRGWQHEYTDMTIRDKRPVKTA